MAEPPAKRLKTEADAEAVELALQATSRGPLPSPESKLLATSSSLPSPTTRYTDEDLVTLLVGPDEHKLVVHAHQLSENSDFFQNALKKAWLEGQTRIVKLPEDCPELLTQYLDFIYGRGLPTKDIDTHAEFDEFDPPGEDDYAYQSLFKLYIFGERVFDSSVQYATISEVIRLVSLEDDEEFVTLPVQATIQLVYEGTLP